MRTAPAVIRMTAAANRTTTFNTYGAYPETADVIRREGRHPRPAPASSPTGRVYRAWDAGDGWRAFTVQPGKLYRRVVVTTQISSRLVD